jgi:hypothetical protein
MKTLKIGDDLSEKILYGIKNSRLLICFMTKKYAHTVHCQKELVLADTFKKKIIVLMFENYRVNELGRIGLILDKFIRINIFKDLPSNNLWAANLSGALYFTIETMLDLETSHKGEDNNKQKVK